MRKFFWNVANKVFLSFVVEFAPQREEIEPALLGMSLTTLGEVPKLSFPLSRIAVARISDY